MKGRHGMRKTIRNTNVEIRNKFKTKNCEGSRLFGHSDFVIWICLGFRASYFVLCIISWSILGCTTMLSVSLSQRLESAGVQLQPPLQLLRQPLAMRNDDEHHGSALLQFDQQLPDLLRRGTVEIASGFVGQEQLGGIDQRRAKAARCRSPPESSAGRCPRRSARPTRSSSISARWTVSARTGPKGTAGSNTFSSTEHWGRR